MTNGEKLKETFPNLRITIFESYVQVMGENYEFNNAYPLEWWNAEYKEPSSSGNPNNSENPISSTTKNCESCRHYGLHHEICNYCYKCSLWIEKDHNLCDSCTNKGCEFQSGIVRTECAFYMPPHLEPDNCGNYVVQALTTKNDLAVKKIIDEVEKEIEKVDIPSTDKLIILAKVQNALYKCAVSDNSEVEE